MTNNKHYSPKYERFYNDSYYWKDPAHEYRPSKRMHYAHTQRKMRNDPFYFLMRRAQVAHDLAQRTINICPSGFSEGQGWAGLYRAWIGFIINRKEQDDEAMCNYARAIRKIEQDMKLQMTQFPELKMAALEYAHDPANADLLEEAADDLDKEVEDLSSEDILTTMMRQDRLAYELAGMDYY